MRKRYVVYLPSPIHKQLTLVPDTIRWSDEYDGGRRFVKTAIHTNTDENHWDSIVSVAIMNQNKSLYKYLRKVLPKEYWLSDGNEHAFTVMITYGLYEWIREFCDEVWPVRGAKERERCDLLITALVARDPIIIELLLQWGLKVNSGMIFMASWRTKLLSKEFYASSVGGTARLSVSHGDFIDLLIPFKDKYNIDPDLLIK